VKEEVGIGRAAEEEEDWATATAAKAETMRVVENFMLICCRLVGLRGMDNGGNYSDNEGCKVGTSDEM
jgi:hypothetical protein